MSDLSSNVTWQEILRETQAGDIPHCRAIACKTEWNQEIIETLSEIILNTNSFRLSHPDLIVIGNSDKAPDIDTCRNLISEIALKPIEAKLRFGVIMCADKLNLNAANSLLKLAEEPPNHARLLFLMNDEKLFLPTLKSRSRFNILVSNEVSQSYKIPVEDLEWVEWLEKARKSEIDEIIKDLEAWRNFETEKNNFILAYKIEKLRIIASKKNLSIPMLCDIIMITLKKGNLNFEYILSDFR